MERQDNQGSDHAIYCVAGITILTALAIIAMRSVLVMHRVQLPLLRLQAQCFALCPIDKAHEIELRKIDRINAILDSEMAKTGSYARIKAGTLKTAINKSTVKTRTWSRNLTCTVLGFLGSGFIWRSRRVRRQLLNGAQVIRQSPARGIEEFLRVTGKYLTPAMARQVRDDPSPQNLVHAFSIARSHVNIPCCRVARLFPKGTRERIALLEYGKIRVAFADDDGV